MKNFIRKALSSIFAIVFAGLMTTSISNAFDLKDPLGQGGTASNMGGPYIAISGAATGAAASGTATNSDGTTTGTIGKIFGSAALQAGIAIPLAPNFLLGIDAHYTPGDANITLDAGTGNGSGDTEDVKVEISDLGTLSIMPMFVTSENSAFYIKAGISHADLAWSGDVVSGLGQSAVGVSGAIGNRTLFGAHGFVQTEFGVSDYDTVSVNKKSTHGTADVNPKTVYGAVSIGVRY